MSNYSVKSSPASAPPAAAPEAPQIASVKKHYWERRKGETLLAYEYALRYITMGPRRSILKVSKNSSVSRHLKRWSSQWQWVKRAAAYDRWMEAQSQKIAERVAEDEARKRGQWRREWRERTNQQSVVARPGRSPV